MENTYFFCDGCDNDSNNRTSQSVSILWSDEGIYELMWTLLEFHENLSSFKVNFASCTTSRADQEMN